MLVLILIYIFILHSYLTSVNQLQETECMTKGQASSCLKRLSDWLVDK